MGKDLTFLFPPGTTILALPTWRQPRLLFPRAGAMQRWKESAFFPASRWQGRIYRFLLRCRAALGIAETRVSHVDTWEVGKFLSDVLPQAAYVTAVVGPPGPAQKVTLQLRDGKNQVVGYLKYAEKPAAIKRVLHEYHVLSSLFVKLGPKPLKCGPLMDGQALLLSPLNGKQLAAVLPPPDDLVSVLKNLVLSLPCLVEEHPWVKMLLARSQLNLNPWLEPLTKREWPVVLQHGDLAPWNVLKSPDGNLYLLDWEYSFLEGFPYLDLIYYILRVAALIYRWNPVKAFRYTNAYLSKIIPVLNAGEIRALIRLAAYTTYLQAFENGHSAEAPLLRWYRKVWEAKE